MRVKYFVCLERDGLGFYHVFSPLFYQGKIQKNVPPSLLCGVIWEGTFRRSPRLNQLQCHGLPRVLSKQVLLSRHSHFQFYPKIRRASSSLPSPAMSHLRGVRRQPKKFKLFSCPCPNHPILALMLPTSWECAVQ